MRGINYKINSGPGPMAPWLVLINGLLATLESWDIHVSELSRDFNILRYDGPGQGKSPDIAQKVTLEEQVDVLDSLLLKLGIKSAFLVGLSNGGRVAMGLSLKNPKIVRGQIVAASYANTSPFINSVLNSWKKAHLEGGPEHRFDVALPWIWGRSTLEANVDLIPRYRSLSHSWKKENVQALIASGMEGELELNEISVPTLFLTGEEDILTTPTLQREMADKVKQAKFGVMNGGHACLLEHPGEAVEIIKHFCRKEKLSELDFISGSQLS
ncbi:MAG: alpha/beta fold hydrolase [Deltaproteobacteria bacterium]|nr:MAG: alpha/beta fold hydrolase [Deltaproteobacteria bacterium]TNF27689.1 MAG: alpha/beta fold hydrolase [Deltaproteobacteria bacterium]